MADGGVFDPITKGRIEKALKKNTKRGAMQAYRSLVRKGSLEAARYVLWLLQNGVISLGLGDNAFEAELALEANGFDGLVRCRGNILKFRVTQDAC